MKFKVGDKVKLNKFSYVLTYDKKVSDDSVYEIEHVLGRYLKLKDQSYFWHEQWFEKVEEKPKPVFDDIKLVYCGDKTVAAYGSNFGESIRSKHDKEDRKIGVLIATMRALGFKKETVDKVVDVLFDDLKEIDKCTTEDLLKEIINRVK